MSEDLNLMEISEAIAGEVFLTRGRGLKDAPKLSYLRLGDKHKDQELTTKLCDFELRPGRSPDFCLDILDMPHAGPTGGNLVPIPPETKLGDLPGDPPVVYILERKRKRPDRTKDASPRPKKKV